MKHYVAATRVLRGRCNYRSLTLKQPTWMSSMCLGLISLGSKQMWLGRLIASLGCLCSHKVIKQKCIRYNVIDFWDMILNKIDWWLFSANVVDWFIRSLSASSKGKVYEVLSITKQVWPKTHSCWLNKYQTSNVFKAWYLSMKHLYFPYP